MFENEHGQPVNYNVYETTEIRMANKFILPDDYVLELGARYGGVSCAINKKLNIKTHQYSVEPDKKVWGALEKNKKANGCEFHIIKGCISKSRQNLVRDSRKFGDGNDWACYSKDSKKGEVKNFSIPDEPFNVLVADCEGFLETFYRENTAFFSQLRCIMIEKDRPDHCDYDYLESEFLKLGFQIVYKDRKDGFHTTYEKPPKLIPKIFYINLDKRTDRREHMEKLLTGYDYERVSAIQDDDGYIGCAKSHIMCIELAKGRNLDKVIILEDDFMFVNGRNFRNMFLPDKYDIFLLCNRIKEHTKIDNTFSRVHKCSWTSGHILNHSIYNDLIQNLKNSIKDREKRKSISNQLDIHWNKLWDDYKCITHNYNFATQREGYSDIINDKIDRSKVQCKESSFV